LPGHKPTDELEAHEEAYARRRTAFGRRAFERFFRLVWGDDVDPALRGLLGAFFASTLAFSCFWNFAGIWAIRELGATSGQVGLTFLLDAIAGAATGYLGGHLSDRVGRKPLMLFSWGIGSLLPLGFIAAGDHVYVGLALMVASSAVSGPGQAAGTAVVADLVPPERHETSYAATRIAFNLGVVFGPPVAGLLLLGSHWTRFFVGVALLGFVTFLIALRFVPSRGAHAPLEPPTRRSFAVIRRDRKFLVFLVSTVLAYVVYFGFETGLPIAAVDSYGLSPSTWGFLIVMNAGAVAFFQLRLTKLVASLPAAFKLAVALPLMGFSFLILLRFTSVAAIVIVLLVFVVGEMLWVPVSQAIAAGMAPADIRGAYMGAFSSSSAVGFALGPVALLQLRGASGDDAMWLFLAAISLVAAFVGVAAVRRSGIGDRPFEEPVA
jgi:MFS family permease